MKNNFFINAASCFIGILIGVFGISPYDEIPNVETSVSKPASLNISEKENLNRLSGEINMLRDMVIELKSIAEDAQSRSQYANRQDPYFAVSKETMETEPSNELSADSEAQYTAVKENALADLSANIATLPEIMNGEEVASMPHNLQQKLLGEIITQANRGELDYKKLFPEN